MYNFTCNPNTEHSDDGLFMYVTPETVNKYPNLFGEGKTSSEPKDETVSFTPKEQEIVATKPKILPDDMDLGDKHEKIHHKFVKELSQLNLLLRHQDTLYMMDNYIYRPYNEGTFISNVFSYICSCNFELSYRDIVQIVNELKMGACPFNGEPNDERYIYCINGYFNNFIGSIENTTPTDYFPTIQLAGAYLGNFPQSHPLMDKFLSTLFDGNDMLIQRV